MTTYQRMGFAAFGLLAIFFLSRLYSIQYPLVTMLKPLATAPVVAKWMLVAALFFSSLGDIALTLPLSKQLELGLFLFLLAHLCYIGLYRRCLTRFGKVRLNIRILMVLTCLGLGYAGLLLNYLWPYLGDKAIPVMVYMSVLLVMALMAAQVQLYCALGAVLFVISDSIIAVDEFVFQAHIHFFTIMLTYYLAQLFLVVGSLKILPSTSQ